MKSSAIFHKLKENIKEYRYVEGFKRQLLFLKKYGFYGDYLLIGEITAKDDLSDIEIGEVGFKIYGNEVILGSEFCELYVLKEYRKKGLGKYLMKIAFEYAIETSKKEDILLKNAVSVTTIKNKPARRILEQLGFQTNDSGDYYKSL